MSERLETIWLDRIAPTLATFNETVTESDLRQLAERLEVETLPVLRNPAVRGVYCHFGNKVKDAEFVRLRDAHGKQEWGVGSVFAYR